jgi:predicted site-specific integrase-resolvase
LKGFIEDNETLYKKRNKTIATLQMHSHEQVAIYARVSASKQKEDLVRQAEFLFKKARRFASNSGNPNTYFSLSKGCTCHPHLIFW